MNDLHANQYNIQAAGRNDHANANHLCNKAEADDEGSGLQNTPFKTVHSPNGE